MFDPRANLIGQLFGALGSSDQKWFLCFGTLLKLCRGQGFLFDEDIDIGVIGFSGNVIQSLQHTAGFVPTSYILDDDTKEYLKITYRWQNPLSRSQSDNILSEIDFYFWKKAGQIYYHYYDEQARRPQNGIPEEYHFKGIPASCFEPTKEEVDRFSKDRKYREYLTKHGTWQSTVPGYETTGVKVCKPYRYGTCLDFWYPDWNGERPGVSKTDYPITVKSCKDLK